MKMIREIREIWREHCWSVLGNYVVSKADTEDPIGKPTLLPWLSVLLAQFMWQANHADQGISIVW
jgi:hypothetical protein